MKLISNSLLLFAIYDITRISDQLLGFSSIISNNCSSRSEKILKRDEIVYHACVAYSSEYDFEFQTLVRVQRTISCVPTGDALTRLNGR